MAAPRIRRAQLAKATRDQMSYNLPEAQRVWSALQETRDNIRAMRAAKKAKAAAAKAAQARRRKERRQQEKHRAQASTSEGPADRDDDDDDDEDDEDRHDEGDEGVGIGEAKAGGESGGSEEAADCAICCEELDAEDESEPISVLQCAHSFHGFCIEQWLLTCDRKGLGKTCPYCRVEIEGAN
jgi:hypothetical protein